MPFDFTCPHCGCKTSVGDEYAGQSGPCAQCGRRVTMPPLDGRAARPSQAGMGGASIAVLVAFMLLGLAVCGGLLTWFRMRTVRAEAEIAMVARVEAEQAAAQARLAEAQTELANEKLAQARWRGLASAMLAYEAKHGTLPPAFTVDADGKSLHSWRVLLLPYLGEGDLYNKIKLEEPWNSEHNRQFHAAMPPCYSLADRKLPEEVGCPQCAVVVGEGTLFPGARACKTSDAVDGAGNTLLVVETAAANSSWMAPRDLSFDNLDMQVNGAAGNGIGGRSADGALAIFADGRCVRLPATTSPQEIRAMFTRAGGEAVTPP